MASATLEAQWKELEPKTGFNFENFARNQNLIKDKVGDFFVSWDFLILQFLFRKFRLQKCLKPEQL